MSGVAVFLGPSLPRAQAAAVLDADYLPPVRQGDIYRLVRDHRPAVIGIVDGYFHQVPSVWHKEILWALDQGVHKVGLHARVVIQDGRAVVVDGVDPDAPAAVASRVVLREVGELFAHHGQGDVAIGFADVRNLAGGIDAWSRSVDPSVERY